MIMTTSVINEYSAGLSFSGTGELNVLGGTSNVADHCTTENTISVSFLDLTTLILPTQEFSS